MECNKHWIGHINGAALYGLNYPLIDAMLRAAEILFKLKPYVPWDATLEVVINDVPNECRVASGEVLSTVQAAGNTVRVVFSVYSPACLVEAYCNTCRSSYILYIVSLWWSNF